MTSCRNSSDTGPIYIRFCVPYYFLFSISVAAVHCNAHGFSLRHNGKKAEESLLSYPQREPVCDFLKFSDFLIARLCT